jgi:phytoene desaturase
LATGLAKRVTVLEKQPRVGGRTSLIEADGYKFDLGPTFFLYPQILRRFSGSRPRPLPGSADDQARPAIPHHLRRGRRTERDADLERMVAEIAKLSPRTRRSSGGSWNTTA